jgi:hypothetical protein
MVEVTFTFDDKTVETLRQTAARLKKPQSMVVREAIEDYASRTMRLADDERRHMLKVFDRLVAKIPRRDQREADTEIAEIRRTRASGGRRTRME